MKIFISGPMTGLPDCNYPAFHEAAAKLRAQGFEVENPAENQAPACGSWTAYMRLSCAQLLKCDAVATLPGWQRSRGARIEVDFAESLEISCKPVAAWLEWSA